MKNLKTNLNNQFIEVAHKLPDGGFYRNHLLPAGSANKIPGKLSNRFTRDREYFRSHWRYHPLAQKYLDQHDTLVGYSDDYYYYPDHIILDFDTKGPFDSPMWKSSIQACLKAIGGFVRQEKKNGLDSQSFQLYFSGTGFHLKIHKEAFGFQAGHYLPAVVKATIKNWWNDKGGPFRKYDITYDQALYTTSSLYRVSGTINAKSGLYKVPIPPTPVGPLRLIAIAQTPIEDNKEISYSHQKAIYEDYITQPQKLNRRSPVHPQKDAHTEEDQLYPTYPQIGHCINAIWNKGPKKPCKKYGRHNIVARLASWLRLQSFPMQMARLTIHSWFNADNYPYDKQDTDRLITDIYKEGYSYGCHDEIMDEFCNPNCKLYKTKKQSPTLKKPLWNRLSE